MRTLVLACAASVLVPTASADRIYPVSGAPIEDVSIVSETLEHVVYKEERRGPEERIPSDEVVRVEYERVPTEIGEARDALADDAVGAAIDSLESYLGENLEGESDRRFEWAPAYAAHRLIELYGAQRDPQGVVSAADRLIGSFPQSRYVPSAYLAKADALHAMGRTEDARAALSALDELAISKNLSKRWTLESRLAQVLIDPSLSGEARRQELRLVEDDAGAELPTVRNRAAVARAESLVAGASENAGALERAREIFEDVIDDPASDEASLAAAYTGLGECLFTAAAGEEDGDLLREALLALMRVPVLYEAQARYVPKALFYAGRCFELLGDHEEEARSAYRGVRRRFPESPWAEQAENFLR